MQSGRFGLDDMLDQMHQLKKLGPLSGILKMIPGMPSMPNLNDETTDKRMKETESIIYSMTLEDVVIQVLLHYLENNVLLKDVVKI